jgi:hypothetical protein
MFSLLQSIYDLIAPRRSETNETIHIEMPQSDLIETINEVGEKRYIEVPKNNYSLRCEKLDILLKQSQSLLNFCLKMRKIDDDVSYELVKLIERVRASRYRNSDIGILFDEFEEIRRYCKKGSKSSIDLSVV